MNNRIDIDKGDDVVHLAGSGVAAFDRPLIHRNLRELDAMLHYAPIDVGVLRRAWTMWVGYNPAPWNDAKLHRAMSDVEGHLREAREFRDRFKLVEQVLSKQER